MVTSPTHNAGKTQKQDGCYSNSNVREYNKNQDPVMIIIVREDMKQIPLNFINSAKPSRDVINCIDPETLPRINKGTVIKWCILPNKLETYANSNRTYKVNETTFQAYTPKQYSPILEELYLDLRGLEDKKILSITRLELLEILQTPVGQN